MIMAAAINLVVPLLQVRRGSVGKRVEKRMKGFRPAWFFWGVCSTPPLESQTPGSYNSSGGVEYFSLGSVLHRSSLVGS